MSKIIRWPAIILIVLLDSEALVAALNELLYCDTRMKGKH